MLSALAWVYSEVRFVQQTLYNYWFLIAIKYTNWSFFCWGAWLVCINYSQYSFGVKGQAPPNDSSKPSQLWKVSSALFTVAIVNQIMVTALYWVLLYPTIDHQLQEYEILKHSVPLICLLIDFVLNNIVIEWSSLLPTLAFITMYLCVMIGYSLPEGQYVYPILKYDSQASWNLTAIIIVAVILVFVIMMVLNTIKFGLLVKPTVSGISGGVIKKQEDSVELEKGNNDLVLIIL